MTYQQSQVFCVVNFKTPFDYQIKGATMEMPQVVPGFSGLFTIWAVNSTFNRGQFKQTLKLIRRRGQVDTATTGNSTFIQTDNDAAIAKETTQSDGTVGEPGNAATPEAEPSDAEKLGSALGVALAQFGSAALASQSSDIRNLLPDPAQGAVNNVSDEIVAAVSNVAKTKAKGLLGLG